MSVFNSKNAIAKAEFNGFGGIDKRQPAKGGNRASECINFRILSDGSLKKRCGFRPLCKLPHKIRAIYTGYIENAFLAYILSGNLVYKYDFENEALILLGEVESSEGAANIFYYFGHVYIIDKEEIYDVSDEGVKRAQGYAPLYGKDWGSAFPGEINEPLNLMTPKVRISYIVNDPPNAYLATIHKVKSVDALFLNGELISPTEYEINENYRTVDLPGMQAGDRVELYLTYEDSLINRDKLLKNTNAGVFGGVNNSRVFMWGGDRKNLMFSSAYVPNKSLEASEKVYSGAGALYFPDGYEFFVGEGKNVINAMERHYDRLLIFGSDDTWMADSDACGKEDFPTMRINSRRGSVSAYGTARLGNDPITVSRGAIVRWTSDSDELNECNAYSISDPIEEMIPAEFFENAVLHSDIYQRELLFSYRGDPYGRVFVYGEDSKQWYTYTGIHAEFFFDGPASVGFARDDSLYVFDSTLMHDVAENQSELPIEASYCSDAMDFGIPDGKKRLMAMNLVAEGADSLISVELESDNGITIQRSVGGEGACGVRSYNSRLSSERFVRATIKISTVADSAQRIYGVTVTAKR